VSHDAHDTMPGYNPDQILHDACTECEARAEQPDHGLSRLDSGNFTRAWERAAAWQKNGTLDISYAEMDMLRTLWAVQVQLEQRGVPIGQVPGW
jgi:hypothetical protein